MYMRVSVVDCGCIDDSEWLVKAYHPLLDATSCTFMYHRLRHVPSSPYKRDLCILISPTLLDQQTYHPPCRLHQLPLSYHPLLQQITIQCNDQTVITATHTRHAHTMVTRTVTGITVMPSGDHRHILLIPLDNLAQAEEGPRGMVDGKPSFQG
jgi:hypothetical protein